jgi:hypothetical protein
MGQMTPIARNLLRPAIFLITVIVLLTTTYYVAPRNFTVFPPSLETPDPPQPSESSLGPAPEDIGTHFHIRPGAIAAAGFPKCDYPILIHVTPDVHCTGALALYGSIVRNTLLQPKELQDRTCVHLTYVDPALTSVEVMYEWLVRPNPFKELADCAAIDSNPEFNAIVPVRWQALSPFEKPPLMDSRPAWIAALNKVHSWGFDVYPRILLLDADSIVITDLHKIFEDTSTDITIAGAPDQYASCHDRSRLNGGMILLRPSRYFHTVAIELLYDPVSSCLTGQWQQSEQELLSCICGYTYYDKHSYPLRPEFHCTIMPIYNSLWPRTYRCSDANILPMRSIHFAVDVPKPWLIEEDELDSRFDTGFWKCVRDATRAKSVDGLKVCTIPGLEETRKVEIPVEETEEEKEAKKEGEKKGEKKDGKKERN